MPISGNSSYIGCTNLFLAHWTDVNLALPALAPLVLKTGLARAGLVTLRNGLQDLMDSVQDKINDVEIASGTLDLKKIVQLARLNEFTAVIESSFGGTPLEKGIRPAKPPRRAAGWVRGWGDETNEKSLCSTLFHLLVPGGK